MIVGGYVLNLYCDYQDNSDDHIGANRDDDGEFYGKTLSGTIREATRFGWKFNKSKTKVLCPYCKKKGRSLYI